MTELIISEFDALHDALLARAALGRMQGSLSLPDDDIAVVNVRGKSLLTDRLTPDAVLKNGDRFAYPRPPSRSLSVRSRPVPEDRLRTILCSPVRTAVPVPKENSQ